MSQGRVWKFSNDVDTDQIIPSQYLLLPTIGEMKAHTFEPVDAGFSEKVRAGDVIVAGENFGSGSSREQAPRVLKELGISAVVAKSFARIFFRNSINIGLPVLVCGGIYEDVDTGDIIDIDIGGGVIKSPKSDKQYQSTRLPEHIMRIIGADGLIPYLNKAANEGK